MREERRWVELATLERVSWFNHGRLLEPIGYKNPGAIHSRAFAGAPGGVAGPKVQALARTLALCASFSLA
ncbi:MAG: hypothetical protein JWP60_2468 [Ramlibacter sp.]|nr:hypothetical protein [Ramlibacter sp.]